MLRTTGWGAGLGLGGAAAWLTWKQPRSTTLPPRSPDDASRPLTLTTPKRVTVVGGGVAGLVTALDLAERGFRVTLLERAGHLGGKLGGWKVKALGETFAIEHGFHGFFAQYYTLREHLDKAGITPTLSIPPSYPILFADRPEERFGRTTTIFPFNLLSVVLRSPTLHLADFAQDGPAIYDLMRYDGEETFRRFDQLDFARFAVEGRINKPMRDTLLTPFAKTTLNRVEALSAAEGIRFFHFYFLGNPEGLWYAYPQQDIITAVISPLEKRLKSLGAEVRTSSPARRLVVEGGRVTGVELDAPTAPVAPRPLRVASTRCPLKGWAALDGAGGEPLLLGRGPDGQARALSARCTHMGCTVAADPVTGGLRCPCHGGTFDADGQPTGGPPSRPLPSLPVVSEGDELVIGGGTSVSTEVLPTDYVVVACEVRGLKELLRRSDWCGQPELERRVGAMGEADPYIVYRLWLDRPVRPDRTEFVSCSGFRYLDSIAVYSHFQEESIAWARRTGGSIVELHAYGVPPELLRPATEMARALFEEMQRCLPELEGARILHEEYQQQSNFSRFAPGDRALRPATETPLSNLLLAGDHIRLEPACALMEAAAMSGRFAANAIFRQEGLREQPVRTVPLKGVLA